MSTAAAREAEDSKPAAAARYVTLKVVDQRQNLVRHTMRTTGKLQAVMDAYYNKFPDVERGSGTFWFDAVCVHGFRTPVQLEMEDGDLIDFYDQQVGGGSDGGFMSAWTV